MVFWANLLHACGSPVGTETFRRQVYSAVSPLERFEMTKAYLNSMGNANAWAKAKEACQTLKRDFKGKDIDAYASMYLSFVLTIGGKTAIDEKDRFALFKQLCELLKRLCEVLMQLCHGRRLRSRCPRSAYGWIRHYGAHFHVKVMERMVRSFADPGWLSRMIRSVVRMKAWKLAVKLHRACEQTVEGSDAALAGDTLELIAEAQIVAERIQEAEKTIGQVVTWRSFIGRMSNAAQSDRLCGWLCLALGGDKYREDAIRFFARGMRRAIEGREESVERKLGANLVRAAWANKLNELARRSGHEVSKDRIKEACATIGGKGFLGWDSIQLITDYVLWIFEPNQESLKAEIVRFSDLKRYPIYLPTEV